MHIYSTALSGEKQGFENDITVLGIGLRVSNTGY